MTCTKHPNHKHEHKSGCGHLMIEHEGHTDYLHDGHLHHKHDGHYDEHEIAAGAANPDACNQTDCKIDHQHQGDPQIPHNGHKDYLINGRLHHEHGDHCDDHGPLSVKQNR